jgi:hypothetical protein
MQEEENDVMRRSINFKDRGPVLSPSLENYTKRE